MPTASHCCRPELFRRRFLFLPFGFTFSKSLTASSNPSGCRETGFSCVFSPSFLRSLNDITITHSDRLLMV